jgi:hypothetical protein
MLYAVDDFVFVLMNYLFTKFRIIIKFLLDRVISREKEISTIADY